MKRRKPTPAGPDTTGLIDEAKAIMGRLVATPVEPHKALVARRKAVKPEPKPARSKK